MSWQRARTPEQIEQRRCAILTAAAELFESEGLDNVSLNGIARHAGVSKANIYRYFETREAIYLHLVREQFEAWVTSVERISSTSVAVKGSPPSPGARAAAAVPPSEPSTPQPLRSPVQGPVGSTSVKTWAKGGSADPALNTSRAMRSIATRMFCWRSAISGSRRKAVLPDVRRP